MPRFFLETIAEDDIQITGADAHHIGYALRMRPGEHLTVCANNIDYDCVIREITKDTVFLDAVSKHACAAEPSVFVTRIRQFRKLESWKRSFKNPLNWG